MKVQLLVILLFVFGSFSNVAFAGNKQLICGDDLGILGTAGPVLLPQSIVNPLMNKIDPTMGTSIEEEVQRFKDSNNVKDKVLFVSSRLADHNCVVVVEGDMVMTIRQGEITLGDANVLAQDFAKNTFDVEIDYSFPSFNFSGAVNDYLHSPIGSENRENLDSFRKKFGFPVAGEEAAPKSDGKNDN